MHALFTTKSGSLVASTANGAGRISVRSSDPDQHAVTDECLRTDISELRGHSNITEHIFNDF